MTVLDLRGLIFGWRIRVLEGMSGEFSWGLYAAGHGKKETEEPLRTKVLVCWSGGFDCFTIYQWASLVRTLMM